MNPEESVVLITGGAKRIGKQIALYLAQRGVDIVVHYYHSEYEAALTKKEIEALGRKCWLVKGNLENIDEVENIINQVMRLTHIDALINNAAIFENVLFDSTSLEIWQSHLNVNLTAPFFLSKSFYLNTPLDKEGRIINILDWRALRPGADHFPYTISKGALATLTKALAQALAPRFTVNGVALGAILPPSDGCVSPSIIEPIPLKRWAKEDEVGATVEFLLYGPEYITGEIIHLDGGRHLT